MDLTAFIRDIHDFPKEGIVFKDITPLLASPAALGYAIDLLAERYKDAGITSIAAIESRGFLFGAPLALRLNCALVPIRKPGKLPAETISQSFNLEYGQDTLEIHKDAISPGDKVLIIDDLLATGGTLEAAVKLVETIGGTVAEIATIIELSFLNGRKRLGNTPFYTCIKS